MSPDSAPTSAPQMYAKWEEVEQHIYDHAESVLTGHDATEEPLHPAQLEWAREMAKQIARDTMMQLDGYEPEDIAEEESQRVAS